MRLFIAKDQAKKLMGGVKFELRARVELTKEERELVDRYNAHQQILLVKDRTVRIPKELTIDSLMGSGETFKCDSIVDIMEYEEAIKQVCQTFWVYLEMMKRFGGEEVIEFPLPEGQ